VISASSLLEIAEADGVVFRAAEDRILFSPAGAIQPDVLTGLRQVKPRALAIIKIKEALGEGRRLTAKQLRNATQLRADLMYQALGELYDWYELDTNYDGEYWLVEPAIN